MSWDPVTMTWPAESTQWLDDLEAAKTLAGAERASTRERLDAIADFVTTSPGPVGAAAKVAVAAGRAALKAALGEAPACLVVTPFQSGVGQGRGNQRYLSAPNMLQLLAEKLEDTTDDSRPAGLQYALVVMFLGNRYDKFADTLGRFNAVMPIPDLQRAERRARSLSTLEAEKWELPNAGTLPRWGALPLERCTVTKAATRSMNSQLSALESYEDTSPLEDLDRMATRKASQALSYDQKLAALKAQFADATSDDTVRARLIGPGNAAGLRTELLQGAAPGHEWGLSAGLLLVGSLSGLSFVRELVGL